MKKSSKNRRMTPADVAEIQRLKVAGLTQDQAVEKSGWSLSSVCRAWRVSVSDTPTKIPAKKIPAMVKTPENKSRRLLTEQEKEQIRRLKASGWTYQQIGEELHRPESTVANLFARGKSHSKVALANRALAKVNGHSSSTGVFRVVTATSSKEFKSKDEAMSQMTATLANGIKARLFREVAVELRAVEKGDES